MQALPLSDSDFEIIRSFLHQHAGIHLTTAKKSLVTGRLSRRLRHYGMTRFSDYFLLVKSGDNPEETRLAIDLLTTNETYFFREIKHFDFLRAKVLPALKPGRACRIWSAACSSGDEPYSIAMTLADQLADKPWEVFASDISNRVLENARTGHYAMDRARHIPESTFSRYCLKGIGRQEGTFLVDRRLRERVEFADINLNRPLPDIGMFDVIFLRNVLIYFNTDTKLAVLNRLIAHIRDGGYLFIGHSESLHGLNVCLRPVKPAVYRKS